MTTIAYANGVLAADTQCTIEDSTRTTMHKLRRVPGVGVVACAGKLSTAHAFVEWLQGGTKRYPKECVKGFEAIVLDEEGKPWYYGATQYKDPIENPFYALGSGWRLAMAGMHMGLSPKQAVELAGQLDIYTNTIVDTFNAKTGRITKGSTPSTSKRNTSVAEA